MRTLLENASICWMARKPLEDKYRFVGGFADPRSGSYEEDARREAEEEAGVEITTPEYVCSMAIDDWRYRNEVDKVVTTFFKSRVAFGRPEAGDDVCEVRWFDIGELNEDNLVSGHTDLLEVLKKKMKFKK